jgi:hypothetical protein
MSKSRREFLITSSVALLGAASASQSHAQNPTDMPPGAPPAFGTAPAVGPQVSAATFAEAEKLVRVELTERDRAQAVLGETHQRLVRKGRPAAAAGKLERP